MKKLFTILCLGLLSVLPSRAALGNPNVKAEYAPQPGVENDLIAAHQDIQRCLETGETSKRIMRRDIQIGTDTYSLILANPGRKITEVFMFGGQVAPHEQYPLYVVEYCLVRYNINKDMTAKVEAMLSWPSYKLWHTYDGTMADNYDMVSLEELANAGKSGRNLCNTFMMYDPSQVLWTTNDDAQQIVCFAIWSNLGKIYSSFEGKQAMFDTSDDNFTTVKFDGYDAEELTINTTCDFFLNHSNNVVSRINLTYDGPFREIGFNSHEYTYNFNDIHIFNAGIYDPAELKGNQNPFDFDFTAKQMYYIMAPGDDVVVSIDPTAEGFSLIKSGWYWADGTPNDNIDLMSGYLFAPVGTDIREGHDYKLQDILRTAIPEGAYEGDEPEIYVIPEDFTMIPRSVNSPNGGSYKWADSFGFYSVMNGYEWIMRADEEHPGVLALNTTEGLMFCGYDTYTNKYVGKYDKDIYYHPNMQNMLEVEKIPSVGTFVSGVDKVSIEATPVVKVVNGEVVVSNANGMAVEMYAVNGARVASVIAGEAAVTMKADKGLYIVKVGETAKKVIL